MLFLGNNQNNDKCYTCFCVNNIFKTSEMLSILDAFTRQHHVLGIHRATPSNTEKMCINYYDFNLGRTFSF